MADNRKYYYLKLKENYFDDDSIVLLESMQDGMIYSNILLKLYLKSLKNGGKLQLDDRIPYTAPMIATLTHQQIGTVERALQIYLKLGLMEVLPDGCYYMSNIELLIGKSSTEGERKKQARLALQAQKDSGQMSGHLSTRDRVREKDRVRDRARERTGENCACLWQISERDAERRGTLRVSERIIHKLELLCGKTLGVHGFDRQTVSEPCGDHSPLGCRGYAQAIVAKGLQRKGR